MKPREIIKPNLVKLSIKHKGKTEVIRELLEVLIKEGEFPQEDFSSIYNELLKRELKGNTAIGNYLAIPHCKTTMTDEIRVVIGLSQEGLDFAAYDGKPVKVIILTISPEDNPRSHLEFLSFISNTFKDEAKLDRILNMPSPVSVVDYLMESQ